MAAVKLAMSRPLIEEISPIFCLCCCRVLSWRGPCAIVAFRQRSYDLGFVHRE